MKKSYCIIIVIFCVILGCTSSKTAFPSTEKSVAAQSDTVRIANEELEYEVIIIDPGFSMWLNSRAFPRNYHSQPFLESKNQLYVMEWNSRVLQPQRYDPNLYELTINYDLNIDYGYEVNYLIYNYMIYFQNTHKQKFFGFVPIR